MTIRIATRVLEGSYKPRTDLVRKRFYRRLFDATIKRSQKRLTRYGILSANLVVLVLVLVFIVHATNSSKAFQGNLVSASSGNTINPLDQISSADIAVHVARLTNLYEATSVTNNADSVNAQLALAQSSSDIVTEPQIVSTALKSIKDLKKYTTQPGDTVSSLAAKFGVTSETIKLSNNLTGNNIVSGVQLWISPVNGIVYLVKAGDTIDSITAKYHVNKDQMIAFNDLEQGNPTVGSRIILPEVQQIGALNSFVAAPTLVLFSGGGGYDPGWCTYYAAARAGVPGNWGNANTWNIYAPLSGWTVSSVPRVGAVAQTSNGWGGHVGIVEAVSPDGSMIKYSDMNGLAGFNRVGYSGWVPRIGQFQRFIYH